MVTNVLIAVVVIGFVLYRQMTPRPVRAASRLPLILLIIGGVQTVQHFQHGVSSIADIGLVAVSMLVGVGLAAARAHTVRLHRDESGQVWRTGTAATLVLWIVAIAQHVAIHLVVDPGLASASLMLYFGAVLLVQNLLVTRRAERQFGRPMRGLAERAIG
ncbi:hypothetical protein [Jongsikchunia kroppenstedtii]|uniref:hypothetical protein n=1 Tax=Jongsikchunia kroppenstedtii TaxID=1121721 RepID=UPI000372853D|nr:hypothetical protein [Jongsikchunia kroppenstedtii]